jgi:hypothetical protein
VAADMMSREILYGGSGSSVDKTLRLVIGDRTDQLTDLEKNLFAKAALEFSLQIINIYDVKKSLAFLELTGAQNKTVSQRLHDTYEFNFAIRQLILHGLHNELKDVDKLFRRAKLPEQDADLFYNLRSFGLNESARVKLASAKQIPILSISSVMGECEGFLDRHERFFNALTWRKLRFIWEGNNFSPHDMASDLKEKAVKVYLHCSPYLTKYHTENSVRNSVNNCVGSMQKFYTTGKRIRKYRDDPDDPDSYNNTIMSLNQFNYEAVNDGGGDRDDIQFLHLKENGEINKEINNIDALMTIDKYVKQGPSGRRLIVDLLILQENPKFVEFVRRVTKFRSLEDVEEVYMKLGMDQYYKMIGEYLDVPLLTVYRISRELRALLMGSRLSER